MAFIIPNLFSINLGQAHSAKQTGQRIRNLNDYAVARGNEATSQRNIDSLMADRDYQKQYSLHRANNKSPTQAAYDTGMGAMNPYVAQRGFQAQAGMTQLLANQAMANAYGGDNGMAQMLAAPGGGRLNMGLSGLAGARQAMMYGQGGMQSLFNMDYANRAMGLARQAPSGGDLAQRQMAMQNAQLVEMMTQLSRGQPGVTGTAVPGAATRGTAVPVTPPANAFSGIPATATPAAEPAAKPAEKKKEKPRGNDNSWWHVAPYPSNTVGRPGVIR